MEFKLTVPCSAVSLNFIFHRYCDSR